MSDAPELTEEQIKRIEHRVAAYRDQGTESYYKTWLVRDLYEKDLPSLLSMARRTLAAEAKTKEALEDRDLADSVAQDCVETEHKYRNRSERLTHENEDLKRQIKRLTPAPYVECQCREYSSIPGSAEYNPDCPVHGEKKNMNTTSVGGTLLYRCRLCNGVDENPHTPLAVFTLVSVMNDMPLPEGWGGMPVTKTSIHHCESGLIGVSDLVGCEPDEAENKE